MKKRVVLVGVAVVASVGVAVSGFALWRYGRPELPTVRVARGDLDLSVYTTGELRSARSAMITAPPVAGTLQIVRLPASGTLVRANDVVVEFDPGEQEFALEQSRSELAQAEQEVVRSKAEADVQAAQDRVALLKARFAVRRAELDLGARELLGAIDARKKELTLEEAQRRLAELEQDVQSKSASSRAALAVLAARSEKARMAMATARQNIANMTVRTPIDGTVVVRQNMDASGGMYFSGMTLPDYRTGDTVGSGRLVAEILDTRGIELQAKVDEADRANLNVGQGAEVRVDALPRGLFLATIKNVSGAASRSYWEAEARRKFEATLQLAQTDERLRPGLTGKVVISGRQLKGVLYVSRQALFEKNGKPVVYARRANAFEPVVVSVKFLSESRTVVEGVAEGTEVALVDPEAQGKGPATRPAPAAPGSQGGRR